MVRLDRIRSDMETLLEKEQALHCVGVQVEQMPTMN